MLGFWKKKVRTPTEIVANLLRQWEDSRRVFKEIFEDEKIKLNRINFLSITSKRELNALTDTLAGIHDSISEGVAITEMELKKGRLIAQDIDLVKSSKRIFGISVKDFLSDIDTFENEIGSAILKREYKSGTLSRLDWRRRIFDLNSVSIKIHDKIIDWLNTLIGK